MIESSDTEERLLGEGKIARIEDGVAWGEFEPDFTFDVPVDDFHMVGDDVRFSLNESPEEIGSTHTFMIMGDHHATILWCNVNDEGLEIVNKRVLTK